MAELKQPAPVGPTGSSPLSRESKETIIHMYYNLDMDMDAREYPRQEAGFIARREQSRM